VKHILEKAMELAEEVKATSEWHRRMSHESLNQKEQRYNLDHYEVGTKVYFYRPPSILDVVKKTRKAKHIDHYVGPATIVKKIGSRSFQLSFVNPLTGIAQLLQRDAGMIILKKEGWMLEQGDQGPGSDIEVRTSCGGRRRGDSSVMQHGSSMEDIVRSFSLSSSC
jgi:hypothetical protein